MVLRDGLLQLGEDALAAEAAHTGLAVTFAACSVSNDNAPTEAGARRIQARGPRTEVQGPQRSTCFSDHCTIIDR